MRQITDHYPQEGNVFSIRDDVDQADKRSRFAFSQFKVTVKSCHESLLGVGYLPRGKFYHRDW